MLNSTQNKNELCIKEILIDRDGDYFFDLENNTNSILFNIKNYSNANLFINNLIDNKDIMFNIKNDCKCNVFLINKGSKKSIVLHENLAKSSYLSIYLADLSPSNFSLKTKCKLNEKYANFSMTVSNLSFKDSIKNYNIDIIHNFEETHSNFELNGICFKNGETNIKGSSDIKEKCIKSSARQAVKVLLFDKESSSKASPILRIDCDDVKASHGCAIGTINDDFIFYLLSRGITYEEAKRIITLSYMKPLFANFKSFSQGDLESIIDKGGLFND